VRQQEGFNLILTNKQEIGLKLAVARYKAHEPWTCIAGYAGTGKSTLVKFIIAALNIDPDDVAYVTFTGKAASVLRHKGCPNAMTAHKLLYYSKRLPSGKFVFSPRKTLEKDYSLIVVDEISMLPNDLWELLLSHKIHVIALGDPFQIPPIDKKQDNHILDNPHIFLDEIMRQAQESEIIRLTMAIREYKPIEYCKGNEVMVLQNSEVVDGMYHWADQIICATNKTRQEINDFMRKVAGRGSEPEAGDKIIALRNKWDVLDISGENAIVNGTIGTLGEFTKCMQQFPIYGIPDAPVLYSQIITEEDGVFEDVVVDYQALKEGRPFLTSEQAYKVWKSAAARPYEPIEFNYGYAITGHKAQGSQWDNVLVMEEHFPFNKEEHARWLYTSCTRAAKKLVLVR
jgi:exodeoxyribonuclease-5